MVISLKDGTKLFGISAVCFCASYVCTFMLNYLLDVLPFKDMQMSFELRALYNAQIATAKFSSAITGGVLSLTAVIMLIFYIKLYIDAHSSQLGIVKALGHSAINIAKSFWVFGVCVFIGCALGFGAGWLSMPLIYNGLTIDGIGEIAITFHLSLLVFIVFVPTLIFTALSCIYSYFALSRPVMNLLRGKSEKTHKKAKKPDRNRPFLKEMRSSSVQSKKMLVFFVSFSCFCYSAMVQMGLSMENLVSASMGYMILIIGLVLAAVSMFMAVTSLIGNNVKNISVMKAFGYSLKDCAFSVLGGYVPFAFIGFFLGTAYQYGLLQIMVNIVFANVDNVPEYNFNIPVFFITLASFIVCYTAVMMIYTGKISKISVKEIMTEN